MKLQEYFLCAKTTNVTWTILTMSFWVLNVVVIQLLSVESQKDLGFHRKYNNLCFKDLAVRRSYGSGMT